MLEKRYIWGEIDRNTRRENAIMDDGVFLRYDVKIFKNAD